MCNTFQAYVACNCVFLLALYWTALSLKFTLIAWACLKTYVLYSIFRKQESVKHNCTMKIKLNMKSSSSEDNVHPTVAT